MVLFRVFGVLDVQTPDDEFTISAEKPRRLLSVLLLRANCWVPDSDLIEVVWPAGSPTSAAGNMKTYVSQLRQTLGRLDQRTDRIERKSGAYRLAIDRAELDTLLFEDRMAHGHAALTGGETGKAIDRLQSALHLWRGNPYQSLDVEEARFEAARLTEMRWTAKQTLADAYVRAGRNTEAVPLLRSMNVENPLCEHTWLLLMQALGNLGRRAEALEVYQTARHTLVEQLGVEPGTGLRDMQRRILQDETPAKPRFEPAVKAVTPSDPTPEKRAKPPRHRVRWMLAALCLSGALIAITVLTSDRERLDVLPAADILAPGSVEAATRYGWGPPVSSAEFTGGLDDGWVATGPRPGREGRGRQMPEQVTAANGVATIHGAANGDTGFLTRLPGTLYGRWEARVRLPAGCACYRPLLTLWPDENGQMSGSEIVYLEVFDAGRQTAKFFLYNAKSGRLAGGHDVDMTKWNNFAVEWTGNGLTGYVNGEPWFHTARTDLFPSVPMHPTVKLDLVPTGAEITSSSMEIDWIRNYRV